MVRCQFYKTCKLYDENSYTCNIFAGFYGERMASCLKNNLTNPQNKTIGLHADATMKAKVVPEIDKPVDDTRSKHKTNLQ